MAYNGSGAFVLYTPGNPVVSGTIISDTWANNTLNDLATGLSTAITRDGQTTTTARINFAQGLTSTLATDATNTTTGSLLTSGGLGVVKAAWIGGLMNVAGNLTVGGTLAVTGNATFSGPLTAGAISGTTGTFSGQITSTGLAVTGTLSAGSGVDTTPSIGTWTPAFTNLTVVNGTGGVTYTGTYTKVGRLVFWTARLTLTGTATTASTANVTSINNLPFTAGVGSNCIASSINVVSGGTGTILNATTTAMMPGWSATNFDMVISGVMSV